MKGMVFTVFIDMVEDKFGDDVADQMITQAELPNNGAYTAVGTYDYKELVTMVVWLSGNQKIPAPELIKVFGDHLFGVLAQSYPQFFTETKTAFDLLARVHDYIHVEVLKLYPDAGLPEFSYEKKNEHTVRMVYRSPRCLGDLAEGLISGCAKHFKESLQIKREVLREDGSEELFTLTKVAG